MSLKDFFVDRRISSCNIAEILLYINSDKEKAMNKLEEAFDQNDEIMRRTAYNEYIKAEIKYDICNMLSFDDVESLFGGYMAEYEVESIFSKYLSILDKRQKQIVSECIQNLK